VSKHRDLAYGDRLPESWLDALQEVLSTFASPNFRITLATSTTIQVVAGADNDQVGIMLNGKWRYIAATINRAHPGGASGWYDIWVTASANSFVAGTPETDNTNYAFALEIRASGTPATALSRKVGRCFWNGSAITEIVQDVPPNPAAHAASHLGGAFDAIAWATVHGRGTLAARPAPSSANNGYFYLATDEAGGTHYRSNGSAWEKVGAAVSAPTVVTSLPGSPTADQEVYLVVQVVGSDRKLWHLRYNASGGTSKWEFLGGPEAHADLDTPGFTGSGAVYTNIGVSVAIPAAGTYNVRFGAGEATRNARLAISGPGVAASDAHSTFEPDDGGVLAREREFTFNAAGTIQLQAKHDPGTGFTVRSAWLRVRPVRLT
jgi:hypothetical protein